MGVLDELERLDERLLGAQDTPAVLDTAFWRLMRRRPAASFAVAALLGGVLLVVLVALTRRTMQISATLAVLVALWMVAALAAVPRTIGRPLAFGVVQGVTVALVVLAFGLGEWPREAAVAWPLIAGGAVGALLALGQRSW